MKPVRSILFILLIFAACNTARTNNSRAKLTEDKSVYYYEQASPYINLSLLGDYKFQPPKTKYFRDIEPRFLKYLLQDFNNTKPQILFSAHTIVQPFYSIIFVLYKGGDLDTASINNINPALKKNLKTSFSPYKEIKCGTKSCYKISYQVTNSITGIYSSNTEYFFKAGGNLYRVFLWTTNSDDAVISNEGEYVIKEAKFE